MSTFISRLKSDDLVQPMREREGGREKCALTSEGRAYFEALFPGHIKRIQQMVPALKSEFIRELADIGQATCE